MLRRTIPWKRTVRNPGLGLRDKVYLPQTLGTLPMPALPCPWIILSRFPGKSVEIIRKILDSHCLNYLGFGKITELYLSKLKLF